MNFCSLSCGYFKFYQKISNICIRKYPTFVSENILMYSNAGHIIVNIFTKLLLIPFRAYKTFHSQEHFIRIRRQHQSENLKVSTCLLTGVLWVLKKEATSPRLTFSVTRLTLVLFIVGFSWGFFLLKDNDADNDNNEAGY